MSRKRVLLLNPPGRRRYLRDGYCSCTSKGSYYYHPLDLLVQSAYLSEAFDLKAVDAIASGFSPERATAETLEFSPDAILFLTGAVSHEEDFAFVGHLKELLPSTLLIGSGDVLLFEREACLRRYPWLDAVLANFLDPALGEFIESWVSAGSDKGGRRVIGHDATVRGGPRTFSYPPPRYDLFPQPAYRIPFGTPGPFGSLLTSMGCPFTCVFCNTGRIAYVQRDLDNVFEDLDQLAALDVRKVYIRDPTFAVNRAYAMEFLRRLESYKVRFEWNCFTRVDLVDEELLGAMKRVGFYLVQYGIESANQGILELFGKAVSLSQVERAVRLTRKAGIGVLGTFVLGLPGETEETVMETVRFATRLRLDYASFNVAIPRLGTPLRSDLLEGGLLSTGWERLDSSSAESAFETAALNAELLRRLRNRAIRMFYLRPSYLVDRVRGARGVSGFLQEVGNGAALIRSMLPGQ